MDYCGATPLPGSNGVLELATAAAAAAAGVVQMSGCSAVAYVGICILPYSAVLLRVHLRCVCHGRWDMLTEANVVWRVSCGPTDGASSLVQQMWNFSRFCVLGGGFTTPK